MIDPTKDDIGRKVIYVKHMQRQAGVITSFNDNYVFVLYGRPGTTSQATPRSDLQWKGKTNATHV